MACRAGRPHGAGAPTSRSPCPDHNLPNHARVDAAGRELPDRRSGKRRAAERAARQCPRRTASDLYRRARARAAASVHVVGPEQGFTLPAPRSSAATATTAAHGGAPARWPRHRHLRGRACAGGPQTFASSPPSKTMDDSAHRRHARPWAFRPRMSLLAVIGKIGAAGGTGHVIEYTGEVIRAMSIEGRADRRQHVDRGRRGARRAGRARRQDLCLSQGPPDGAERRRDGMPRWPWWKTLPTRCRRDPMTASSR